MTRVVQVVVAVVDLVSTAFEAPPLRTVAVLGLVVKGGVVVVRGIEVVMKGSLIVRRMVVVRQDSEKRADILF